MLVGRPVGVLDYLRRNDVERYRSADRKARIAGRGTGKRNVRSSFRVSTTRVFNNIVDYEIRARKTSVVSRTARFPEALTNGNRCLSHILERSPSYGR